MCIEKLQYVFIEKTEWIYLLKSLASSLLDVTEMEFECIVDGRQSCFERYILTYLYTLLELVSGEVSTRWFW